MDSGTRPRFSADGRRLAFLRGDDISIANADSSQPRRVLTAASGVSAALSPNGQSIAFFRTQGGPVGDLWTVAASGGAPRRLTFDEAAGGHPVWTPDGRTIVLPFGTRGQRDALADTCGWGLASHRSPSAPGFYDPDISVDWQDAGAHERSHGLQAGD